MMFKVKSHSFITLVTGLLALVKLQVDGGSEKRASELLHLSRVVAVVSELDGNE